MIVENKYVRDFLLGGKCECAIENTKTGNYFEYKITMADNTYSKEPIYFIEVKRGMWLYAGHIKKENDVFKFFIGKKGLLEEENIEIKALLFVLKNYERLPSGVNVHHFGRCARCHRKLSDEESIKRGLGPECYKKVMG